MSMWSQLLLQESSSMTMQMLSLFHDYSLGVIMMILVFVSLLGLSILSNKFLSDSVIVSMVEVVWTMLPMLILIVLVIPSLQILYTMEEDQAYLNLKVMGFQWYWSYDYNEFEMEYESYMEPKSEYRLLDVDHRAVLPVNKNVRGIISAADVIHCWALPSAGVKVDAVPGRLNQLFIHFIRPSISYGQCSEICGANHSFMPIGVEAVKASSFLSWCTLMGEWQSGNGFSICSTQSCALLMFLIRSLNPFNLVDSSPWPFTGSLGALCFMSGLTSWFNGHPLYLVMMGVVLLVVTVFQWWRDVVREGTFLGKHTFNTLQCIRIGMMLFIVSEVMLFFAFFWAFFHSSLAPTHALGGMWPPQGINALNPWGVPLLNTIVLLSSGVTITWSHHSILEGNLEHVKISLALTILLGGYFTMLQLAEYMETSFSLSDSVFGSTFFMATGLHGFHVIVGTLFILVSLFRSFYHHFTVSHHFGFEAAAWYWHFVDVVWLFLFLTIYWWGS